MLKLAFHSQDEPLRRVLVLGAHSDDIEIGCGGTLLRLAAEHPEVHFYWVVFAAAAEERAREARASAKAFLGSAEVEEIAIFGFRDGFLPYAGAEVKECFEQVRRAFEPDLIFTHYRQDRHQDHRTVSDLTWNTFRDHLILEYEIPKYDGDLGNPNFYVALDEATAQRKAQRIVEGFPSQSSKSWFGEETFLALSRLRGLEANARHAEAFYSRKLVF